MHILHGVTAASKEDTVILPDWWCLKFDFAPAWCNLISSHSYCYWDFCPVLIIHYSASVWSVLKHLMTMLENQSFCFINSLIQLCSVVAFSQCVQIVQTLSNIWHIFPLFHELFHFWHETFDLTNKALAFFFIQPFSVSLLSLCFKESMSEHVFMNISIICLTHFLSPFPLILTSWHVSQTTIQNKLRQF